MHFDLWTLAFQVINFAAFMWLLQRLLYQPVRKVLDARRAAASQQEREAQAARADAESSRHALEQERTLAAGAKAVALKEAQEQATRERESLIEASRREAEGIVALARKQVGEERDLASQQLRATAMDLSLTLATRLLLQVRSPDIAERFLTEAVAQLEHLPAGKAAPLRALDGGVVRVVTAPGLTSEQQARWAERLRRELSAGSVEFAEDETLVCGAEVQVPRGALGASWRDALDALKKEVESDAAHAG